MAKVNRLVDVNKYKWEPFVEISLSKREAVGLLALTYVTPEGIVRGQLFNYLFDSLKPLISEHDLNRITAAGLSVEKAAPAVNLLDKEFGTV